MLSKEQQDKLKEMLLTPIRVDKLATSIKKVGNTMISPQIYKGVADPDMSDLSITFYEIIYKDILPENHNIENKVLGELDEKKDFNINAFADSSFAGDTMNSFNTIAGEIIKELSIGGELIKKHYYMPNDSEGRLRLILDSNAKACHKALFRKYYDLYHSLANFWIIPMEMGRKSAKKFL
ncbi:hypothetical protein [Vagococcus penaei]|uniref:hypothetical protein n=1 Tax=Vagococcus penaei TaxID=633807 RepID=UPI001E51FE34|nr:hypothetical protein [Vagococcus penaei]